jgi:hypothetical protein|tara:strand:+ start:180 stop:428 length:249 start_codon:yes stop_codon:yes gene_type:complete
MSKVKKIKDEELKKIVEITKQQNEMLRTIGVLEAQKQGVLVQLADNNKSLEAVKKDLEDEYGQVNVNLEDGSYTEIEKEDDK